MAKFIIKAVENMNIKVFPDYNTAWHYDDKVAQKYLLESVNAPLVNTFVFYDKEQALKWVEDTTFPKVFKLRKGSGSKNVLLAKNKFHAKRLIRMAFGKGFPTLDMKSILKERYRKFKLGKESGIGLIKGFARLYIGTPFRNMSTVEKGYVYFQEFMPGNEFDQRIIVIGKRAFGLKRMVRKNDFRASGSGNFYYQREEFDLECVQIAFDTSRKLSFQCMAYDFIYDKEHKPKIVEVSFAFNPKVYLDCPGYWDNQLKWHDSEVSFSDWMVEDLINSNA
jgi:glutathione synthase/RimK-type ligase-like ATP-grasp enzyme